EVEPLVHFDVLHNVDVPVFQTGPALTAAPQISRSRPPRPVVVGYADIACLARINGRILVVRVDVPGRGTGVRHRAHAGGPVGIEVRPVIRGATQTVRVLPVYDAIWNTAFVAGDTRQ